MGKTSRRQLLANAGKGLLALVGAGVGINCINPSEGNSLDSEVKKEINERITLTERESDLEQKGKIKQLYENLGYTPRYGSYTLKPYLQRLVYFSKNNDQIIKDFGGIDNIHRVLPWTKQRFENIDKAALAEAHMLYLYHKKTGLASAKAIHGYGKDNKPFVFNLFTE